MFNDFLRRTVGLFAIVAFIASAAGSRAAEARTIYLVRHGAYNLDPANGATPVGRLTPLGLAQARLVAARLRGMTMPHLRLISSTLPRAVDTAKEVAALFPAVAL